MKKLIIIGAGGHGKVIADAAEKMNIFQEISFLDDSKVNETIIGFKVIDTIENIELYKNTHEFIVGIGNNETRFKIQSNLESKEYNISTIAHPSSIIGKDVEIGQGTVIMAGAIVNPSVKIGKGCIVNTSVNVDHDCKLSDYVHLSPNVTLSGTVHIGKYTWIGTSTTVINNITIGEQIVIGSHSNVIKNINERGVYYGNVAKKI